MRDAIRVATPADRPALAQLQSHLPEPAPDLLRVGLAADDVLVSTVRGGFEPAGSGADGADDAFAKRDDAVPPVGTPVGYLLAVRGGADLHIAELVVAPARRREGRASALVDAAIEEADGRTTLAVAADNGAARSLYREKGFQVFDRREGHFASGTALFLERD